MIESFIFHRSAAAVIVVLSRASDDILRALPAHKAEFIFSLKSSSDRRLRYLPAPYMRHIQITLY